VDELKALAESHKDEKTVYDLLKRQYEQYDAIGAQLKQKLGGVDEEISKSQEMIGKLESTYEQLKSNPEQYINQHVQTLAAGLSAEAKQKFDETVKSTEFSNKLKQLYDAMKGSSNAKDFARYYSEARDVVNEVLAMTSFGDPRNPQVKAALKEYIQLAYGEAVLPQKE